ncbi:response regulator transcription factor [Cryobacterium sp. PH29-G1]|uniref:response regulator transcription factor n=1 Tax=Cryobacterium sp. PH29-G1 TaxID=3046211 RepID=UPI0024B8A659|nr:response regulator transcription factor [Cryobacterium sp. PH29-G1]MDJ0350642.1 response regulator transcription factor [Cryobacterium sp. PH29-G1]
MTETTERVAVVIEDDPDIQEVLEAILIEAGFVVHLAGTGAEGVALMQELHPTLTTLDVNMPGMDGFETLKRLRRLSTSSIIMISARFDEIDVVHGLSAGADDFVAKPFRTAELRARIDAALRRAPLAAPTDPKESGWLQHDGLRLHVDRRLVQVNGTALLLTRSEFDLLASLFQPENRVHTKHELVLQVRSDNFATSGLVTDSDRRSLEVHVANLRKKIGRSADGADRIETVRGVGYRLAPARS